MNALSHLIRAGFLCLLAVIAPAASVAAPFAAYVMDARTGKQIHAQNADTKLHPASLTKMMTLYIAFESIERGKVRLDTKFLISTHAASEPPSKLGLKAGQRIELRYLIRAAAVKSANDAATAIGEGLAGSEAKFAARMTATARALGMKNSQFKNANGLTAQGHYSTARDMSILGRRLFYDYPQYYSIFSRRSANAGVATVNSTNKRFLDAYEGADGIKTGYTRAAGFNLTASAKRGQKRIIATVMGGTSTAQRNAVMAELLDAGFGKAPTRAKEDRPDPPVYMVEKRVRKIQVQPNRLLVAPPPVPKPARVVVAAPQVPAGGVVTAARVSAALSEAIAANAPPPASRYALKISARPRPRPGSAAPAAVVAAPDAGPAAGASTAGGMTSSPRPPVRLERQIANAELPLEEGSNSGDDVVTFVQTSTPQPETLALAASAVPKSRSKTIILASLDDSAATPSAEATEIVSRASSSGGRHWGISLGLYPSQHAAEQQLLKTALAETSTLDTALRKVNNTKRGFEANFVGMNKAEAELACSRLAARRQDCAVTGP